MTDPIPSPNFQPPRPSSIKRKAVNPTADLVQIDELVPGHRLPVRMQPKVDGIDLVPWAGKNQALIERNLVNQGGILFRGFGVDSVEKFHEFVQAVSAGELLQYEYASTPRSRVLDQIYTSTEYPADQGIPLHNEMSYSRRWPMKTAFYCHVPAAEDGQTPLADSRLVLQRIDAEVRDRFRQKQIQYVRNYGGGLDLSWEQVFQTNDRQQVQRFCEEHSIDYEWRQQNRLRTRQTCQATAMHPTTRQEVWFNQAHLFHNSSLLPSVRELLLSELSEDELPRNVSFGDGSPIDLSDLDHIRQAFVDEEVVFDWRKGDVLLLDNMLVAHGRRPFTPPRQVYVGMSEAIGPEDCQRTGQA